MEENEFRRDEEQQATEPEQMTAEESGQVSEQTYEEPEQMATEEPEQITSQQTSSVTAEEEQPQAAQAQPVYARLEQYRNPYIMNQGQNAAYGNVKPAKVKKKHPVFKKMMLSIVAGIVFGIFAGLGVYVVFGLSGAGFGMAKIDSMRTQMDEMEAQLQDIQAAASSSVQTTDDTTSQEAETGIEPKSRDIEIDGTNEVTQIPQMDTQTVTAVVTDVTEVVKTAMPCVVSITNLYTGTDWYGDTTQEEASGSGIIVGETDDELLIVTNYHVIEGCDELSVKFIDDSEALAYVKGTDSINDLAVITVFLEDIEAQTKDQIAIATLGDSDALQVGEPAIAIGNSLGYGQSVTTGVISALNREVVIDDNTSYLIQTDAAINPGNSGGALLNVKGEVIGINSNKIANYVIEGMGYAIPITTAKPIIEELMQHETRKKVSDSERSFLGISGTDVTSEVAATYDMPMGVYIAQVLEGSAAESAGLLKGDIITAFDGDTISSMSQLQGILEYYAAGSTVELTIMRHEAGDYQEQKVTVTLGAKSE